MNIGKLRKYLEHHSPQDLLESLDETGLGVVNILQQIALIAQEAQYGYQQERVTAKGEVIQHTQKDMKTALDAYRTLLDIRIDLELLELTRNKDKGLTITFTEVFEAEQAEQEATYDFS